MTPVATVPDDIDPVLFSFAVACPIPTPADVETWCARHPASAPALRDYAEIAAENFDTEEFVEDPKLDAIAERVFAAGMARIGASRRASLPDLIKARGTTIPKVAAAIDIDRGILADIAAGRLIPPVGPRLVVALSATLGAARQAIREAVAASFEAPRVGFASSEPQTPVRPRTWAESVAASTMSEERKDHWREET